MPPASRLTRETKLHRQLMNRCLSERRGLRRGDCQGKSTDDILSGHDDRAVAGAQKLPCGCTSIGIRTEDPNLLSKEVS